LPSSHFGTDVEADAVQITRVSPCSYRHDPVAVRTKPGSIETGRGWELARS
jgi:hypothetical protein